MQKKLNINLTMFRNIKNFNLFQKKKELNYEKS